MLAQKHLLIAGASGVIGAGALEHFGRLPGWRVTALSRRVPVVSPECEFTHLQVNLADRDASAAAVATLPAVTHLIYAAAAEAHGLVKGWYDPALIAANGRMLSNLLDPLADSGHLQHVSILQGAKAYGGHYHHSVEVPSHEDRPRDEHPNFYWLHEDITRDLARKAGFNFTILRPQVLMGAVPGAAMNIVAALGAYAVLTKELGLPFAFPGRSETVWEMIDTGLLAEAFEWAATSPAAANEVFNITNGDVMVMAHAWRYFAAALGTTADGEPPRTNLAAFFAEPATKAAWSRLVKRHQLRVASLSALLGESQHYLDLLLSPHLAERPVPLLLSTIKIRQAGFNPCRDSMKSLMYQFNRMVELGLLPSFDGSVKEIDRHADAGKPELLKS